MVANEVNLKRKKRRAQKTKTQTKNVASLLPFAFHPLPPFTIISPIPFIIALLAYHCPPSSASTYSCDWHYSSLSTFNVILFDSHPYPLPPLYTSHLILL